MTAADGYPGRGDDLGRGHGHDASTRSHGDWVEHALRRIGEAGLRTGPVRESVVEHLATEGACLVSAQELADALRAQGRGSTASVYRALDELLGLELVQRIHGPDGVARYEIAHHSAHHHHFIDDRTGAVTAFEDASLEEAIHAIATRLGVRLSGHEVVLRGIACSAPAAAGGTDGGSAADGDASREATRRRVG